MCAELRVEAPASPTRWELMRAIRAAQSPKRAPRKGPAPASDDGAPLWAGALLLALPLL
jgi:hypothetical protein